MKPDLEKDRIGRARRFIRQDAGNVAMLFGMLLLPMLGAIGLAVDFGVVLTARTKAQVAADAAVLQAAGVARELIKNGDGSPAATTAALLEAKQRADALFKAHAERAGLKGWTVDTKVTREGQTILSTTDYTVTTDAYVSKVFGEGLTSAGGDAKSTSSLPTFTDVYVAVDISQSMGIAATQDEMKKLYVAKGKVKGGDFKQLTCVFGCHTTEPNRNGDWIESFSAVAKRNNIRLRIDVLRDATKELINTAASDSDSAPVYQIGLYAMGMTPNYGSPKLIELAPVSNRFNLITKAADKIDLGSAPGGGSSDSYLSENITSLSTIVPKSGTGAEMKESKKFAFIITDGARDVKSGVSCTWTGNRCVSAIDTAACDTMKKNGVTVGVLYTTYVPIRPIDPDDTDWYQTQVVNTGLAAAISPKLQSCASPGWFYQASDAAAINAAMQAMFAQTAYAPKLTN